MKKLRKDAAGIDIGSKDIFIGIEGNEVRSFPTYTSDFLKAKDYLLEQGITSVAMEATGVYWIALYDILVEGGIDVWLIDGKQTKQVPGRKTDVKDCQWIQQLHSHGLLSRCFIPDKEVATLRGYFRMREDHIRSAAMHVNHMHKALIEMNIRLTETLSQIHGASGLAMIKAIIEGERDPYKLLSLCHKSIKKNKPELVIKALQGHYTEEGIFKLRQAYDAYYFYQGQIMECDAEIERHLKKTSRFNEDEHIQKKIESVETRKPVRHNKPDVDYLGGYLLEIFGHKDPTVLPGITDYSWLQLYCHTGNNLTAWPTEKHFTSWLGLAPGQHSSGKMNRTRSKRKTGPKAGQIFRQIGQTLIESKKIALGAFGRKLKAKHGPGVAVKATARKLAVLYWRLMVKGLEYTEKGIKAYEEKMILQKERWLQKAASELGIELKHSTSP